MTSQLAERSRALKLWALSHLPGRHGNRYIRKRTKARRPEVIARFEAALAEARGKLCIDLGANMGEYTLRLAEVADRVIAFEPDPWTVRQLRDRLADHGNVEIVAAAAGTAPGTMPLYRSPKFAADPQKGSLSSTLVAEKSNVGAEPVDTVEVVDFCAYLDGLDSRVALLKIDIEGGEVALLEALFDHPALAKIDAIFVETHETKLPSLAARSRALRRRARRMTRPLVEMDWY